jgi:hypothetical protein
MPDWNTRLAVSYQPKDANGEPTGDPVDITPIDSFTPTFSLSAEALHSIEATHIGVVYTPKSMTFTMTVRAVGTVVASLTKLALEGTRFDVILQEGDGEDWSFTSVVMSDCLITSAGPSAVTISGAPTASFSGFSLSARATPKQGAASSIP